MADPEDLDLSIKPKCNRAEMREKCRQNHPLPWVLGLLGGNDSILVVQMAFETPADVMARGFGGSDRPGRTLLEDIMFAVHNVLEPLA